MVSPFPFEREGHAPGSLFRQSEEEGSHKYCDNSRNKLVRRGFESSELQEAVWLWGNIGLLFTMKHKIG